MAGRPAAASSSPGGPSSTTATTQILLCYNGGRGVSQKISPAFYWIFSLFFGRCELYGEIFGSANANRNHSTAAGILVNLIKQRGVASLAAPAAPAQPDRIANKKLVNTTAPRNTRPTRISTEQQVVPAVASNSNLVSAF